MNFYKTTCRLLATGVAISLVVAIVVWFRAGSPFHAAETNRVLSLQKYLDSGGNPNATAWTFEGNISGQRSLLYFAVRGGAVESVRELLKRGAVIDTAVTSKNPGRAAVIRDDPVITGILIDAGIRPFESTGNGFSMWGDALVSQKWRAATAMATRMESERDLAMAIQGAMWGDPSESRTYFIITLLAMGLDPDANIGHGETLRSMASKTKDSEVLQVLHAIEARQSVLCD